jgi:hypothetical protein
MGARLCPAMHVVDTDVGIEHPFLPAGYAAQLRDFVVKELLRVGDWTAFHAHGYSFRKSSTEI